MSQRGDGGDDIGMTGGVGESNRTSRDRYRRSEVSESGQAVSLPRERNYRGQRWHPEPLMRAWAVKDLLAPAVNGDGATKIASGDTREPDVIVRHCLQDWILKARRDAERALASG